MWIHRPLAVTWVIVKWKSIEKTSWETTRRTVIQNFSFNATSEPASQSGRLKAICWIIRDDDIDRTLMNIVDTWAGSRDISVEWYSCGLTVWKVSDIYTVGCARPNWVRGISQHKDSGEKGLRWRLRRDLLKSWGSSSSALEACTYSSGQSIWKRS